MLDLKPHLESYRSFLEAMWFHTHREWQDEQPSVPSRHMCRYSSLFLKRILKKNHDINADIIAGRPSQELDGTPQGEYGFEDANGNLHDHCWLQVNDWIIDITADQFGAEKIILTQNAPFHHASPDQSAFQEEYQILQSRVDKWLQAYILTPLYK